MNQERNRSRVGDDWNADGISIITNIISGNDIAGEINTAPHLEGIQRIEPRIAVRSILSPKEQARRGGSVLLQHEGVRVRDTARLWPLIAIDHVGAAGDFKFDGAATGDQRLRAVVNLSVHGIW